MSLVIGLNDLRQPALVLPSNTNTFYVPRKSEEAIEGALLPITVAYEVDLADVLTELSDFAVGNRKLDIEIVNRLLSELLNLGRAQLDIELLAQNGENHLWILLERYVDLDEHNLPISALLAW